MTRRRLDVTAARVYDATAPGARRVLIDRLWPRGVRRDEAHLDEWCRDVAPSDDLRHWYGHDPERFPEFARRYREELQDPARSTTVAHLQDLAAGGPLVLLTATRDVAISNAAVLAEVLAEVPVHRGRE